MAQVIERIFSGDDSFKDVPSTYEKATVLSGRRLDRRKNYAIIDGQVCELAEWTESCSGCTELVDGQNTLGYPIHKKHGCAIGGGCEECGYHGVVRDSSWVPLAN